MNWWQKLFGIEEAEQDLQGEQDQRLAEYRVINMEMIRAMAEQNGIEMEQCSTCGVWFIEGRGPWCDCSEKGRF